MTISNLKVRSGSSLLQNVTIEKELRKLIAVEEPYYALENVNVSSNGELEAFFPMELIYHHEVKGISLSEAGRHVAILGSLALAYGNPGKEKHYYLATDAVFERLHAKPLSVKIYRVVAETITIDSKIGVISAKLYTIDNDLIYKAEVRYAVIHHRIFERLFRDKKQDTPNYMIGNPYAVSTSFNILEKSKSACKAYISPIRKEECIGHFDHFPALPVARIAGALIDLSGFHNNMLHNLDNEFCVRKVKMHAESFIFAGEDVRISTQFVDDKEEGDYIESFAQTDIACRAVDMKCWFY